MAAWSRSTTKRSRSSRGGGIIAALDAVGSLLILQLAFFVVSLGVITTFPAALALQRQLADLHHGRRTGFGPLLREFARLWRHTWPLGVLLVVVTLGFAVGLPFWFQTPGPFGLVPSGILAFLAGLCLGIHVAALWVATRIPEPTPLRLLTEAWTHLVQHPLRTLWGVCLLVCWIAVLVSVPVLALVGSGLVPAVIVRLSMGVDLGGRTDQARRS